VETMGKRTKKYLFFWVPCSSALWLRTPVTFEESPFSGIAEWFRVWQWCGSAVEITLERWQHVPRPSLQQTRKKIDEMHGAESFLRLVAIPRSEAAGGAYRSDTGNRSRMGPSSGNGLVQDKYINKNRFGRDPLFSSFYLLFIQPSCGCGSGGAGLCILEASAQAHAHIQEGQAVLERRDVCSCQNRSRSSQALSSVLGECQARSCEMVTRCPHQDVRVTRRNLYGFWSVGPMCR